MQLQIYFKSKTNAELRLLEGEALKAMCIIGVDINFDSLLLTAIDKFLKENKIDVVSLKKAFVSGSDNEYSTSGKIAETVVKAINIAIKGQN